MKLKVQRLNIIEKMLKKISTLFLMVDVDEAAYNPEIMPILVDNALSLVLAVVSLFTLTSAGQETGLQPFSSSMQSLLQKVAFEEKIQ